MRPLPSTESRIATMPSCLAASLLIIALGAAGGVAQAQMSDRSNDDPRPQLSSEKVYALDASLERVLQEFSIPGLAVGIVENGVPVYVRAFGVRDTRTDEPANIHTLFHVASITKTFTAAAIMQLAERNQLSLDDPIARHVPAFADSSVTIRQLLTHSAGLRDVNHASVTDDDAAVLDYVAKIAGRKPAYASGKGWEYSDAAFNVLGAAIESASGQSYPQYMQTQVLGLAGMTESTFTRPAANGNIAWPHTGRLFVRRAADYPWDRAMLPSAGLNASITDMTQWAAVHLNRDPSLLSPASYDALFKRQLDSRWQGMAMGLGWQLEQRDAGWLPGHASEEHGFSGLLTLYPEQRRAIVILSNGETTPRHELRKLIEAVLAGGAFVPLQPPLLLRAEFQWTLGGLIALTLLLSAMTVRYRGRRSSN
jgi:CubicO group peptidase (beta-lactamase class C family)